ncbi:hypothetical protein OI69_06970 [Pectobacterium fontis]|uniref:Uncharacterized protein n=1 Tax=Pectobacterium fontis TaxID=2558042 RepID=A0A7V8IJW2_9GAMM|nr:hypothetical protein OI69_06970 [Pectobacterium fontis]
MSAKKNPTKAGFFIKKLKLLNFSFFVDNVLTDNWIEFLQFQFFRLSTFVLRSGIEVTSTSRRNQLDLLANTLSHDSVP